MESVVLDLLLAVALSILHAADDRSNQSGLYGYARGSTVKDFTYETAADRYPRKRKGVTAKRIAKRRRAEGPVIKAVRAACVERDGYCRVLLDVVGPEWTATFECQGPSEWAHIETRARTRNMRPEVRHNTKTSVMLCRAHHDRLDGRARPRIRVELQTGEGADGPLTWRTA